MRRTYGDLQAEKELAASDAWLDRPKPAVNVEIPKDIAESSELPGRIRELMNLIPLMLQTDSARVVSLMIQDNHVVPNIAGVQAGHHPLSHHGLDPAKIAQPKIIESGILSTFSDFLTQPGQRSAQGGVGCWITRPFFSEAIWAMRTHMIQAIYPSSSLAAATIPEALLDKRCHTPDR
jgi:Protein of unknown function (DUF1552)